MALSVIAECVFGIEVDALKNPDDPVIKNGREAFSGFRVNNWLETIMFS